MRAWLGVSAMMGMMTFAACGTGAESTATIIAGDGSDFSAGWRVRDVPPGEINTLHVTDLCVSDGDRGELRSVELEPGSGLEVRRFTVPAIRSEYGGMRQPFEELGIEPDGREVDHRCSASSSGSALYVEVIPTTGRSAYSAYFTLEFEVDGVVDTLVYPLGVTMCLSDESEADFCTSKDVRAGHLPEG